MTEEQSRLKGLVKWGFERVARARLAKTGGTLRLTGLRAPVEVIRDRWGVPHITALHIEDLYFAQGFVHAQDRFWQMEFQRRLLAGRLAELFGELAVSADQWMRVVGMRAVAEEEARLITGELGQILQSYSEGVNAFLSTQRLPLEFALLRHVPEPWSVADSLSWSKMMAWMLSGNWECELLRGKLVKKLGPLLAADLELHVDDSWPLVMELPDALAFGHHLAGLARSWVGPGAPEGVGSNSWVVAGSRTVTGKPMLANDMHLLLNAPAVWYENHLMCGEHNVTGVSLPGLPLVISGQNQAIAWGFTAGYADVQDLYEEHLRPTPDGGLEYETEKGWLPVEVRREEIRVRGGDRFVQEVLVTRHGPIISSLAPDEAEAPLALRWAAYETSGGTFAAMARLNQAQSCQEVRSALSTWGAPVLNVIYADVAGSIGYTLAGKVPVRARGDGRQPVPGWTGGYEWVGTIPYEELPHMENPPEGFIVTANNRVAGGSYPHWLGWDFVSGDRAERITEMILQQPVMDMAYMRRMQFDLVSPSAQTMARVIASLSAGADLQPVIDRMRVWDGVLSADSPDAAIYEVLTQRLLALLLEHRLEELLPRYTGRILHELSTGGAWGHHAREWLRAQLVRPESPWFNLGGGETREDILRLALRQTIDFLVEEQGPVMENWSWGWYHRLTFHHVMGRQKPLDRVFDVGPFPVGGDGQTIWATTGMMDRLDSSEGVVGPPFRFLADLSDLRNSLGLLAPGQSGQPGSPHYDDQVQGWFDGGYHPILTTREEALREQEAVLDLAPVE
jgi:penicillin amidase